MRQNRTFKQIGMKTFIKSVIALIRANLVCPLIKVFNWNAFHYSPFTRLLSGADITLRNGGGISIGTKFKLGKDAMIASNGGMLTIGNNVGLNTNCSVVCQESITIGDGTSFGPNVAVYDHDHLFDSEHGVDQLHYKKSPVVIGRHVWIGANTVILRGTSIGDNCVVGAGCVLKGTYPPGSLIVQKRETEIKAIK